MEKKIRKIQKWLERCLLACRSGSWENALAEMECANAEMKIARRNLWALAESEEIHKKSGLASFGSGLAKAAILAIILIFVSAMPLSKINVTSRPAIDMGERKLEFVSLEEENLLQALRKSLSDNGFRETAFTGERDVNVIDGRNVAETGNMVVPITDPDLHVVDIQRKDTVSGKTVLDVEKLITLVQIGERVLRESEPDIHIQIQR